MKTTSAEAHLLTFLESQDGPTSIMDAFVHLCFVAGSGMTKCGVFFHVLDRCRRGTNGRFVHLSDDLELTIESEMQDVVPFRRARRRAWDQIEGR